MYSSLTSQDDYRLTLGALEKINNQWVPEYEQRLAGTLDKKTFKLDEGHSAQEVFQYYFKQTQQLGGRLLFQCRGRSCGSSNSWANTRFHVKQLYGLDDKQFYAVFEVDGLDSDSPSSARSYVTLYGVTRGNKRSFIQLDVMQTRQKLSISATPEVIVEQLTQEKTFTLSGFDSLTGQLKSEHLSSLVAALKQKRHWTIAIVGHDFSPVSLEQQKQASLVLAQGLRDQLIAQGVKEQQIVAYGLGGLVPRVNVNIGMRQLYVVLVNGQ
jgi:outer membrane protein OmpA-like peptidoglycan-associated protein